MDDLVEVATFALNEVDILETLLQEAGISYFLKNRGASIVMPNMAAGGITLVVRSPDAYATIDIIRKDGFEKFLNI